MERKLRNRTIVMSEGDDTGDCQSADSKGLDYAIDVSGEDNSTPTVDIEVEGYSKDRVALCIQLNVLLYSTCYYIQQSCLPYFSKRLGANNVIYGYLQTAFALFQLAGGPLFGRFGDLFGARAALTLAYISGVLTYTTLAMSTNLTMLFVSRAFSLFLSCMQGSRMVIVDIVPHKERADHLGKLGLWYGIGMVLGPFIGGQITKSFGEEAAALTAAVGSGFSVILVNIFVPKKVKSVDTKDQSIANIFDKEVVNRLLKYPNSMFLMTIKVIVGMPIGILYSVFSQVAMETFNLKANYNGLVMSYIGIVSMLVQGIGVGLLTRRYEDRPLMGFSTAIATFSYMLMSQVSDIRQFCVSILPLTVGMTTMEVVIGAALTKAVPLHDTGSMIGLGMAANSVIRTISPTMGGYMLEWWGFPSIGYCGGIVCGVISYILFSPSMDNAPPDYPIKYKDSIGIDSLVIALQLTTFIYSVSFWIQISCFPFRNAKRVGLHELGPRFTLKLRSIQKGTFDSKFGKYE